MPIKRLYHKLTDEPDLTEAAGFDADTLNDRRRDSDVRGQRLQLIVYTALFAFIVLAAYGYYLIFNLTHDVHSLSNDVTAMTRSVNKMTLAVDKNMAIIGASMIKMRRDTARLSETISSTMPNMSRDLSSMNENTSVITKAVLEIDKKMHNMSQNMNTMSQGIVGLQRDMWSMNQTVSNPVESAIDGFMPWGSRRGATPGSPGPMPFPRPSR